jgi:isopenicillin N synthase-like dioxygenase
MQAMPSIDLSVLSTPRKAAAEARQLDLACRRVGAFEVVGHMIPRSLQNGLFACTRQFFALPEASKAAIAQPAADQVRGWSACGREGIAYSLDEESPADLKEKLDMGPAAERGDEHYRDPARSGPHLAPNLWPAQIPRLQGLWESYYDHLEAIGAQLLSLAALSWGMPEGWFDDKVDKSVSMLRALYYPDQPDAALTGQLRAGVHSDYGAFTGAWLPVATSPGRLVVLLGDLLAEWTADEWPSTLHRVVNPIRGHAADCSRLAFAFYQEPNYDLKIDILAPFRVSGQAASPALIAGEHLRQKYLLQTTFGRQS